MLSQTERDAAIMWRLLTTQKRHHTEADQLLSQWFFLQRNKPSDGYDSSVDRGAHARKVRGVENRLRQLHESPGYHHGPERRTGLVGQETTGYCVCGEKLD